LHHFKNYQNIIKINNVYAIIYKIYVYIGPAMAKNLPIDVLRSFVTVADIGGVTAAGQLLGRTQPAISLQIKRLETLLDTSLFSREGQGLTLTEQGAKLYGYAQQILLVNDEAVNEFVKPTISGLIRFGIPSEFATAVLPGILGRFTQAYPGVTLEITCDLSKNLLDSAADRFDLTLALRDPSNQHEPTLLREDQLVWASSRSGIPLDKSPTPLIVAPAPCIYRARAINALKQAGQRWRIVYTNTDLTGISAAIEEGLGITVLAYSTVPKHLRILGTDEGLPELGKVGIHLIRDRRKTAEAVNRLAEFVTSSLERI
jgi:DNA-binding transcriptional LysR family regulator